jgi:hypothetical protein
VDTSSKSRRRFGIIGTSVTTDAILLLRSDFNGLDENRNMPDRQAGEGTFD